MGNFLDKNGLTRFKEKMLTEVDKRIASGGGSTSGDAPTKEEIIEGATRVSDVEVSPEIATIEALQTAVARVESNIESLGNAPSPTAYVTQTWQDGTSWYRKWSDGFIEQGGNLTVSVTQGNYGSNTTTLTLPIAFSGTNYYVGAVDNHDHVSTSFSTRNTTSVVLRLTAHASNSYKVTLVTWYASGY